MVRLTSGSNKDILASLIINWKGCFSRQSSVYGRGGDESHKSLGPKSEDFSHREEDFQPGGINTDHYNQRYLPIRGDTVHHYSPSMPEEGSETFNIASSSLDKDPASDPISLVQAHWSLKKGGGSNALLLIRAILYQQAPPQGFQQKSQWYVVHNLGRRQSCWCFQSERRVVIRFNHISTKILQNTNCTVNWLDPKKYKRSEGHWVKPPLLLQPIKPLKLCSCGTRKTQEKWWRQSRSLQWERGNWQKSPTPPSPMEMPLHHYNCCDTRIPC